MNRNFSNLYSYIKFVIKKEKFKLALYTILMSAFLVSLVPIFDEILSTSSNMQVLIETMKNPAMIAMVGPVYVENSYTTASMYSNYMTVFTGIILAIWNILFVTKETRKDEEEGRLELLRSSSFGRLTNLSGILIICLIVNLLVSFFMILGFDFISKGQIKFSQSINFGLSMFVFAFLFAAITGFFAQISSTSRLSNSLSFMTLFVFYLLRAIGDVSIDILSKISPLGLLTKTQSYIKDQYLPIFIIGVEAIIFLALAFKLAKDRDLNEGYLKESRTRTSLSPLVIGITSFNLKLLKNQIIIWGIVIYTFSAMYGSVLGDLEGYISSSEMMKKMIQLDSDFSITDQFISLLLVIMAMISTLGMLTIFQKILADENNKLSEELLTKPLSRYAYLGSYFVIAIVSALAFQAVTALGFWSVGKYFLEDLPGLDIFMKACFNYLPAILIHLGLSTLIFGIKPKFAWLSYIYLGYSMLVVYIGKLFEFPEFMKKLSPFGLTPTLPTEEFSLKVFIGLSLVFIALSIVGFMSYRERDIN